MIFKHNKNISRNLIVFYCFVFFLFSCGGGGESGNSSSIAQPNPLTFSVSSLPSSVESYDLTSLQVISSIDECKFQIDSEDFLWISSSDGKNFNFRAPIIYVNSKDFTFNVSAISNTSKPECTGSKTLMLNVVRHQIQFIPDPEPSNIPYLSTPFFTAHDVGFGGIEITDRYSATVCYPTENDCVTYRNELFGQDAHNIATGDFNGDGFEDLVVAWAIFPHTIDQSKKIYGPINIYLNDQNGGFAEDLNLYAASNAPKHPFAYRLVIDDLNGDGLDDIFAGSMGLSVKQDKRWGIDPYPHFLLLSNTLGKYEESSANINDENNGLGQLCRFAHDASAGDFDGDGDFDIYACNILHVNNGLGQFTIHPFIGYEWHTNNMSPMSSLVTDLNNDNFDDILFWNFDNRPLFDSQPEEGTILLSNNSSNVEEWEEVDLPKGPFDINRNKYNHAASGDLNGDGFNDVVVSITRDNPYYDGAYIQILINDQTGELIDQTPSNFSNQDRFSGHHGEGNIYLRDIDNDGDLDIIHSTRDFENSLSGAHIAINDGQANFASNEYILPKRPLPDSQWNSSSGLMKGVPINLDGQGCIDIISTTDSWSDENTVRNFLFSMINVNCSL